MQNAWVSLGYNLLGFQDEDFSAADYTAQGPFVRFRIKFDQDFRPATSGAGLNNLVKGHLLLP